MIRNVYHLFSITLLGQLLLFISLPLMTKLYPPNDLGFFASFSGMSWIIVVIGTLQIEHLIILAKSDNEEMKIIALSLFSSFIVCIFSCVLMWQFNILKDVFLCLLQIITSLSICINQLFRSVLVKRGNFKKLGYLSFLNALIFILFYIFFGYSFSESKYLYLIIAQFAGYFFSIGVIFFFGGNTKYRISQFWAIIRSMSVLHIKATVQENKQKIVPLVFSNLLKTTTVRLPSIFLPHASLDIRTFSGQFAISERLVSVPGGIIGQSVGNVARNKLQNKKDHDVIRFYKKIVIGVGISCFVLFLLFGGLIKPIFLFIFPKDYEAAIPIIYALCIAEIFNIIFLSVEDFRVFKNRINFRLLGYFLLLIANVLLMLFSNAFFDFYFYLGGLVLVRIMFVCVDLSEFVYGRKIRKYFIKNT